MQRPIEFRIWDKEENSWLDTRVWHNANSFFDISKEGPVSWFRNDERFVCQQFTGILDKGGKKIFEGDIVKAYVPTCYGDWYYRIGVVKYSCIDAQHEVCDAEDVRTNNIGGNLIYDGEEVIGNIFENKELLK